MPFTPENALHIPVSRPILPHGLHVRGLSWSERLPATTIPVASPTSHVCSRCPHPCILSCAPDSRIVLGYQTRLLKTASPRVSPTTWFVMDPASRLGLLELVFRSVAPSNNKASHSHSSPLLKCSIYSSDKRTVMLLPPLVCSASIHNEVV